MNSTDAANTKTSANLRSFEYRPGAMNRHTWFSHSGDVRAMPAAAPTFRRIMKPSNGSVCSSWQATSPWCSRLSSGMPQYGAMTTSPRLGRPKSRHCHQKKPKIAPMAMNSRPHASLLRRS